MARLVFRLSLGLGFAALAASAHAATKLTPVVVFLDATVLMKLVMVVLAAAILAAIVITARKLSQGPHLTGGSTFLSSLRLGGPLLGLFGAGYTGLNTFIGIANINETVPLPVLAPGFAEAFFLFTLGLTAGVVAVIGHGIVEARIDRAVLRS